MNHTTIFGYIGVLFAALSLYYQRRALLATEFAAKADHNIIASKTPLNNDMKGASVIDAVETRTAHAMISVDVCPSNVTTKGRRTSLVITCCGFAVLFWRASLIGDATASDVLWCSLGSLLVICGFLMSIAEYIIKSVGNHTTT